MCYAFFWNEMGGLSSSNLLLVCWCHWLGEYLCYDDVIFKRQNKKKAISKSVLGKVSSTEICSSFL